MRDLTARELEIVQANKKSPKPVLDLPEGPEPISDEVESWIILLPVNVRDGLIQTINKMLGSVAKMTPDNLRVLGELRDAQNLYFVQKGDYFQKETSDVNELLSYLQVGYTTGGELINDITPVKASQCVQLLKYALDSPQHGYEWMDYEARFNDYVVALRQENDLVETDAKILRAWVKVLGEYSTGTPVPSTLLSPTPTLKVTEPADPKYANSASPYKYNVANSLDKQKVRDIIIQVARSKGYPENRLLAHIWYESRYNAKAENPSSTATGLGQFLKNTGHAMGLDPFRDGFYDPTRNSSAVVQYMTGLMSQSTKWGAANSEEAWKFALACYYEGSGFVIRDLISAKLIQGQGMKFISSNKKFTWAEFEPSISGKFASETRKYVQTISKLALTPP